MSAPVLRRSKPAVRSEQNNLSEITSHSLTDTNTDLSNGFVSDFWLLGVQLSDQSLEVVVIPLVDGRNVVIHICVHPQIAEHKPGIHSKTQE
jgi:hypothetical protein